MTLIFTSHTIVQSSSVESIKHTQAQRQTDANIKHDTMWSWALVYSLYCTRTQTTTYTYMYTRTLNLCFCTCTRHLGLPSHVRTMRDVKRVHVELCHMERCRCAAETAGGNGMPHLPYRPPLLWAIIRTDFCVYHVIITSPIFPDTIFGEDIAQFFCKAG